MGTGYIYSSELVCLVISFVLLMIMLLSRPKVSRIFVLVKVGMLLSFLLLLYEHITLIWLSIVGSRYLRVVDVFCFIYCGVFLIIITLIIAYINRLSSERKLAKKGYFIAYAICYVFYMVLTAYFIRTGKMYYVDELGYVVFDGFIPNLINPALIAIVGCFVNTLKNRMSIPRPIYNAILFTAPTFTLLMIGQYFSRNQLFLAVIFVLPLVLFFILFHSSPYDDVTGCLNVDSFSSAVERLNKGKVKYSLYFINLPKLGNIEYYRYAETNDEIQKIYADTCRKVEYISSKAELYRLNHTTFAIIYKSKEKDESARFMNDLMKVLDLQCEKANAKNFYRIVAVENQVGLETITMVNSYVAYIFEKYINASTFVYHATDEDYADFKYRFKVEQMLMEIRDGGNLDDERVKVFIQPIRCLKADQFRTGEALMRLEMDGKTVFPDVFIPLAEKNECIHALTRVILNKSCQIAKELSYTYDFDAITVNVSSTELSEPSFCTEVIDLIKQNNLDNSYIRLELTESAIFTDYDVVKNNIKILYDAGVYFYLDDFGTGYSNLERIVTCPFHTIKFDKGLLYRAIKDPNMEELIQDMIQVFKKKGFSALVEGVETDEQREFCARNGFEYIQGYFYSKPVPADDFASFLDQK